MQLISNVEFSLYAMGFSRVTNNGENVFDEYEMLGDDFGRDGFERIIITKRNQMS